MQQFRTCQVADHKLKVIEHVCIYTKCQKSRFLCSKCILGPNHKHNQSDISHIVDNSDFQEMIQNKLSKAKGQQQQMKSDIQKLVVPFKQLIQEIQNLLKNVKQITQQIEQGQLKNLNVNHLENQLLNVQIYGFNQIDDQQLNNLINMSEQQQELDIYKQLEEQSNMIIQNALKIKEWRLQQVVINQQSSSLKINDAKYSIQLIEDMGDKQIFTGAISNDLKYIVSGGEDKLLKIWDYSKNKIIKSIQLVDKVWSCKFTEDSTLLYAGSFNWIYQFDPNKQFKELYKQQIHTNWIINIYCISNTIILTASCDNSIIKTDVNKQQQLLKIQSHDSFIFGLDYNKSGNMIASGSYDKSLKLWNGTDGSLILQKLNAHEHQISQVLFIMHNNQLISLSLCQNLIIWKINNQAKQLEQLNLMENSGYNISLVLQQQYIISIGSKFIRVHSIEGEFVRQFNHEVDNFYYHFTTIQLDSMKAVLIKGRYKLQVCKLEMD